MKVAIADLYAQSGKTTLALNLGAALAESGATVLVVDADPRGQLDGLDGLSDSGTVLDRRSIQMLRATSLQGLQVVTGTGRWLTQASTPPSDLGTLQAWFPKFDWVLFDTSAQNRTAMEYSIGLSDYVLSPLPMEAEAFRHTPDFLRLLTTAQVAQPTLIFGGFVPYHRQPAIAAGEQATARETLTVMSHEFPQVAWQSSIPFDPALLRPASETGFTFAHSANVHTAFAALATELADRLGVAAAAARPPVIPEPPPPVQHRRWWQRLVGRRHAV